MHQLKPFKQYIFVKTNEQSDGMNDISDDNNVMSMPATISRVCT